MGLIQHDLQTPSDSDYGDIGSTSPYVDSGIGPRQYNYTAYGINAQGNGPVSDPSNTVEVFEFPAIKTDLVSWWTLNEASGTRADSHDDNDLTDNNTVGSAAGKVGNAADLEASSSEYLSHASNASLVTGDIDWTFACWIRAESLSSFPIVASKGWGGDPPREWVLFCNTGASNKLHFEVEDGDGLAMSVESTDSITTNTWYFVVVQHDAGANEISVSINAGTPDTAAHSTGVREGSADFVIGASPSQSLFWDGLIDEVGFWKRILSADEIEWLYNDGNGRGYSELP